MIVQADFVTKVGWFVIKVGRFVTNVGRILQTTSKDFDFDTYSKRWELHKPSLVPREGRSLCTDFSTACKTSINSECLRVVLPTEVYRIKLIKTPRTLHWRYSRGAQWRLSKTRTDWWILKLAEETIGLVKNTHRLMNTRAFRKNSGPCRRHART